MKFVSLTAIVAEAEKKGIPFWKAVMLKDCFDKQYSKEESFEKMRLMYRAMEEADKNYDPLLRSESRLSGGDGQKLENYFNEGNSLCGGFLGKVIASAVKMGESNACMKRIVAAPTAGSCGVLPSVLITIKNEYSISEDDIVKALFTAAGVGEIIAIRASISGAQGGCQAEIGSASAMAAAALAQLKGGNNDEITHAAALALKSMLGLTCDPVAGLVEVPCIKRNVMGAITAFTSADMALAGVRSAIPPDEVIDAMGEIGSLLPKCLRETSTAGLAVMPTAVKITKELES
ncbi:MAG: L-serine ammonia-lyase, iron-sulfur-dependent, subunit alpha [Lachnospiraceae bacterium]|nr:L-serine ammonia-lyase, iron-sulfur-dependent, subunit alpha [Lachnospiraceae bacterium]